MTNSLNSLLVQSVLLSKYIIKEVLKHNKYFLGRPCDSVLSSSAKG